MQMGTMMIQQGRYEEKAKETILSLLNRENFIDNFRECRKKLYEDVSFMQKKFRDRRLFKVTKAMMYLRYWEKTLI